jgi:hypothetical protein
MQFYAQLAGKITEATEKFSPLSTPLIIRAIRKTKENYLLETGG